MKSSLINAFKRIYRYFFPKKKMVIKQKLSIEPSPKPVDKAQEVINKLLSLDEHSIDDAWVEDGPDFKSLTEQERNRVLDEMMWNKDLWWLSATEVKEMGPRMMKVKGLLSGYDVGRIEIPKSSRDR